ncbi:MAG: nitroreductase family protein [Alistipes sp.]
MAAILTIDTATCIRCGKCVKVCPSQILTQTDGGAVGIEKLETCISCGHCAAVCPTGAIRHLDFPPEKVHLIDRRQLPTPDQLMLLCKARRSNRAFSSTPIPAASLRLIVEAAHRAPTACNLQQISFTVITDPAQLQLITQFTIDTFAHLVRLLENPFLRPVLHLALPSAYDFLPAFHRLMRAHEQGDDQILRGATAVIFIHAPRENRFGILDANLAYQNGSLMAEALGVSQFYTGFVYSAIQRDKKNKLAKMLGIEGTIHAGMALGIPQFLFPNYIDKKPL